MLFNKNGGGGGGGGGEKSGTEHDIETNMAVPSGEGDNTHSRGDTNTPKSDGRQGIPECKRFQRMETEYKYFSSLDTAMGETRDRPVCLQNITPTSKICKPKSGSTMYESGCISNELGKANSLCFPPPPPSALY